MLEVGSRLDAVARIAVLRANAVGDFLAVLPALEAVRAAYPGAEIVLLGADWHADFLAGRPGPVDRVVPVPPSHGVREPAPGEVEDPAELAAFFEAMRAERFDLALQLHGGGRWSNPLVRRLGARCTAGLSTVDAEPLDRTVRYAFYQPEVIRFLEVVALVGAPPVVLEPRIALRHKDIAEVDTVLAGGAAQAGSAVGAGGALGAGGAAGAGGALGAGGAAGADGAAGVGIGGASGTGGQPVVALHPGARDGRRRWPAEHFAAVGDGLAERGARVLITGSAAERPVVTAVRDRMRHPSASLAGELSLGGLAALYARCAVVVSNDTGPRHLAAAVGAPTVAVYWCGTLTNYGPLTRTRQRAHVSWTVRCPVCGAEAPEPELPAPHRGRGCPHDVSFVASVTPAAVLADAVELLTG